MIQHYKSPLLIIGYSDGNIQLIQYTKELLDTSRKVIVPLKGSAGLILLLSEFNPQHDIPPSITLSDKETILSPMKAMFDGNICCTYGMNGYLQELYTIGYDLKIKQWGLRYAVNPDFTSFEIDDLTAENDGKDLLEGDDAVRNIEKEEEGVLIKQPEVVSGDVGEEENNKKKVYVAEVISPYPHSYIVAADNLGVS